MDGKHGALVKQMTVAYSTAHDCLLLVASSGDGSISVIILSKILFSDIPFGTIILFSGLERSNFRTFTKLEGSYCQLSIHSNF
jgi:hypothetical protein